MAQQFANYFRAGIK